MGLAYDINISVFIQCSSVVFVWDTSVWYQSGRTRLCPREW